MPIKKFSEGSKNLREECQLLLTLNLSMSLKQGEIVFVMAYQIKGFILKNDVSWCDLPLLF
jgi:hypothetical protein